MSDIMYFPRTGQDDTSTTEIPSLVIPPSKPVAHLTGETSVDFATYKQGRRKMHIFSELLHFNVFIVSNHLFKIIDTF